MGKKEKERVMEEEKEEGLCTKLYRCSSGGFICRVHTHMHCGALGTMSGVRLSDIYSDVESVLEFIIIYVVFLKKTLRFEVIYFSVMVCFYELVMKMFKSGSAKIK